MKADFYYRILSMPLNIQYTQRRALTPRASKNRIELRWKAKRLLKVGAEIGVATGALRRA